MKEIQLTRGKVALVDDRDYEYLMQWKWCAQKTKAGKFYAKRGCNPTVLMHRIIAARHGMQIEGLEVDHCDHTSLNNQLDNLRPATSSQNKGNTALRKNNTSGFKGVSRSRGKWKAEIAVEGKRIHLKRWDNIIDAARAYNQAAIEYFGKFAHLNVI